MENGRTPLLSTCVGKLNIIYFSNVPVSRRKNVLIKISVGITLMGSQGEQEENRIWEYQQTILGVCVHTIYTQP